MALNVSTSAVILFGTLQRLKSLPGLKSVNVIGRVVSVSNKVKILGAILDSNLTMEPHTKTLSSSCFYHIRSLKLIRLSLDDSMAGSVVTLLVSSHLDYANSILHGTSLRNINRLQRIQHSLSSVMTHQSSFYLLPLHSSNSSTGFRLNDAHGLNSPL